MADKNIFYLNELSDYKVDSDYPDVRGWDVMDADNRRVGLVDNLLVNKKAKRVVYLDVEVDKSIVEDGHDALSTPANEGVHEFRNKDGDNHLVVPIGMVELDEENKQVISTHITHNTFSKTRRFAKDEPVLPEYELTTFTHYAPGSNIGDSTSTDDDFYDRKEFRRGS